MPSEQSKARSERMAWLKREVGKSIFQAVYDIEISDPGNHIAEVQSFLQKGGNLVLYANHIAFDDPVIVGLFYLRFINPHGARHLIIPASHWHMDPQNNKKFALAGQMAESVFDAEIFKLIQSYMVNNSQFGSYSEAEATANHKAFFSRLRTLRQEGTPTDLLIFPEGHRSDDGKLGKIEEGIILAGSLLQPTVYLPIGIHYETSFKRSSLNTRFSGMMPHLTVGNPTFQEDRNRPTTEMLIHNLAQFLPVGMRGIYR